MNTILVVDSVLQSTLYSTKKCSTTGKCRNGCVPSNSSDGEKKQTHSLYMVPPQLLPLPAWGVSHRHSLHTSQEYLTIYSQLLCPLLPGVPLKLCCTGCLELMVIVIPLHCIPNTSRPAAGYLLTKFHFFFKVYCCDVRGLDYSRVG